MLQFGSYDNFTKIRDLAMLVLKVSLFVYFFILIQVLGNLDKMTLEIFLKMPVPIKNWDFLAVDFILWSLGIFVTLMIIGNLRNNKYRFYLSQKKIFLLSRYLLFSSESYLGSFNDIGGITVSSIRQSRKHGYYYIPTLNLFLKSGQEIVLNRYKKYTDPNDILKVNKIAKELALKLDCYFYPGVYGNKARGSKGAGGKIYFRYMGH